MLSLSDWIARRIWFSILWLMRRDFIRNLQALGFKGDRRAALVKQNLFAYKYGLRILRGIVFMFLAYLLAGFVYWLAWTMAAEGYFKAPGAKG